MKKVMHFILDALKIYIVGFIAITLVVLMATAMQLFCADQGTAEQWEKIFYLILWLQIILAPFAAIFSIITVIVDRNKLKEDENYAQYGFMHRVFSFDEDENGLG